MSSPTPKRIGPVAFCLVDRRATPAEHGAREAAGPARCDQAADKRLTATERSTQGRDRSASPEGGDEARPTHGSRSSSRKRGGELKSMTKRLGVVEREATVEKEKGAFRCRQVRQSGRPSAGSPIGTRKRLGKSAARRGL